MFKNLAGLYVNALRQQDYSGLLDNHGSSAKTTFKGNFRRQQRLVQGQKIKDNLNKYNFLAIAPAMYLD